MLLSPFPSELQQWYHDIGLSSQLISWILVVPSQWSCRKGHLTISKSKELTNSVCSSARRLLIMDLHFVGVQCNPESRFHRYRWLLHRTAGSSLPEKHWGTRGLGWAESCNHAPSERKTSTKNCWYDGKGTLFCCPSCIMTLCLGFECNSIIIVCTSCYLPWLTTAAVSQLVMKSLSFWVLTNKKNQTFLL